MLLNSLLRLKLVSCLEPDLSTRDLSQSLLDMVQHTVDDLQRRKERRI